MGTSMTEECKNHFMQYIILLPIPKHLLFIVLFIMAFHGIYVVLKTFKETNKMVTITTLIFYVSTEMIVIYNTFSSFWGCWHKVDTQANFRGVAYFNFFYGVHYCTFIMVVFMRVKLSFFNSAFALSKCTEYCYMIMSLICALIFIICLLIVIISSNVSVIMLVLAFMFISLFCAAIIYQTLFCLFISKLKKLLQKDINGRNSSNKLQYVMMKNVLLSTISVCGTCIWILFLLFISIGTLNGPFMIYLYGAAQRIDVFVNCLCIYLTMKATDRLYFKLCGKCHVLCGKACCGYNMDTNDEIVMKMEMKNSVPTESNLSVSPKSKPDTNRSIDTDGTVYV
eukprot:348125_1